SNILSFENNEDHASIEPIIFNNDLSILIGPNGSGKSNCLEVISKLFTNILIKDCVFNEQNLRDYDHGIININLNNTLSEKTHPNNYLLPKHRFSDSDKKSIKVTILLSDDDKNNLTFIYQNIQDLNNF
ncbi:MAG TPA: hypothetical protein VER14_04460, partial [Phototrophicaceae bacterium]|nr:hypothetical protein [Phototrophicaceae bacterium]